MATQTIQVASIKSREVTTKFGLKKAYDLYDSVGNKYGFGFADPARQGINIGTFVTGNVEVDKYGSKFDPKTVTASATGSASPVPDAGTSAQAGSGSGSGYAKSAYKEKVFPVPPTHGDMAIIRQNALSNATALVSDYVATLPAEKFPKLDEWTDMVIDVSYKFAKFSSGHREAEAISKLTGAGIPGTEISAALAAQVGDDEG